ncbi:hypothetical protein [Collimonas fungivorans]|uniref:hypothetical protein n=1 Tax=Collimonas fungivorans TaxID=158899 RepID=UPI003FA39AAF
MRSAERSALADYLTVGYLAMSCLLDKVREALSANAPTASGDGFAASGADPFREGDVSVRQHRL